MIGKDGLGNTHPPKPKTKKIEKCIYEFLVDTMSEHPGGNRTNPAGVLKLKKPANSSQEIPIRRRITKLRK